MPESVWTRKLADPMHKYALQYSIGDLTPTLCALAGLHFPEDCEARAIPPVIAKQPSSQKILIFCPDAIGEVQRRHYPADFRPIEAISDFRFEAASVMPSVTPVCFATIFSGAAPEVHGIHCYEKPVLRIKTLFDVFAGAGKEVAIVSMNNCSIDRVFRERAVDYFSFRTSEQVNHYTRLLLENSNYDLIVSYDGAYDQSVHQSGRFSDASLGKMRRALQWYLDFVELTDRVWHGYDRTLVFAPDHGAHDIGENEGTHGSDIPDDMVVNHFYRLRYKNT